MLTLVRLTQEGVLVSWDAPGADQPVRLLYTTKLFREQFNELPVATGYAGGRRRQPSHRAALEALMSAFVNGEPPARLIRPHCEGMYPTFQRMRPPHTEIVEMRTQGTRTFGFFHCQNVFVAHCVATADDMKREANGYTLRARAVRSLISRLAPGEIDGTSDVADLVT